MNTFADNLKHKFLLDKEQLTTAEQTLVFPQSLALTPTTVKNLEKILYPICEQRNILLIGDAGIGKNALVYYINSIRNLPTVRFSFNQDTLPDDLVGSFHALPNGFRWTDGPLLQAVKHGYSFVADEMNLASPDILKRFINLLQNKILSLNEKDGSDVIAHKRFHFIATQNPSKGFEGRKILPKQLSRLFTHIYLDSYPIEEEITIMQSFFEPSLKDTIAKVVHLQRAMEESIWTSKLAKESLEHYHFNIRSGKRFWNRIKQLNIQSINSDNAPLFFTTLFTFYVDCFPAMIDKEMVLHLISDIFNISYNELGGIYNAFINRDVEVPISSLLNLDQHTSLDPLPLTQTRVTLYEEIKNSLNAGENLLLEAEEDVRVGELVTTIATLEEVPLRHICLSKGMHTSEIIGALRPTFNEGTETSQNIQWVDGALITALKNNEWILLENIEAAGSDLVEKLNMLLDDAAQINLPPESGIYETIKKNKARIIAIKYFRKSRSQNTISRAFRNRFFSLIANQISDEEILQSIHIYFETIFDLDITKNEYIQLLEAISKFHTAINTALKDKAIGKNLSEGFIYREENALRWIHHIFTWIGKDNRTLVDIILSGLRIHYLASLPTEEDRIRGEEIWEKVSQGLPLDFLNDELNISKKKIVTAGITTKKKVDWDAKKHFREANTGKAKHRLSGRALKKGIKINTPETGGKIKEGADAWYGEETHGNKGNGEPQNGGGAQGYRTEQVVDEFLKKFKPILDYDMGVELKDYYSIFGKALSELNLDLENAFEKYFEIEKQFSTNGQRIDVRKYINFKVNNGSNRIFEKTIPENLDQKFEHIEIVFLINKGRRLFNLNSAIASIVTLQSAMEVLSDYNLSVKTFGYSDFGNLRKGIDLIEYTQPNKLYKDLSYDEKNNIFLNMVNDWNGDTIDEYSLTPHIPSLFSSHAKCKMVVFISDFRGFRGKPSLADELKKYEIRLLKNFIEESSLNNYVFLGIQTGGRNLAEHLFKHHIWITEENFNQAPFVLSEVLKEMIIKYSM